MKMKQSDRGFRYVEHPAYTENAAPARLVGESSAVGDYDDSLSRPGSSFLFFGLDAARHHLNREEVAELVQLLQHWLDHGQLLEP